MPLKKRQSIGQVHPNAKRARLLRAADTPEERDSRLEHQRRRQAEIRAAETPGEHRERVDQQRRRQTEIKAAETRSSECLVCSDNQ